MIVRDHQKTQTVVEEIMKEFGKLDIWVRAPLRLKDDIHDSSADLYWNRSLTLELFVLRSMIQLAVP